MRKLLRYIAVAPLLLLFSCKSDNKEAINQANIRPVSISILYDQDSDLGEWLKSSAQDFLTEIAPQFKGVRVTFSFISRDTTDAINSIANGKEKADAIIVPHPEFANTINAKTKNLGATISSCRDLIASPVVAIAPRSQELELSSRLGKTIEGSEALSATIPLRDIGKIIKSSRYSQRHPLQSAQGKLSLLFSILALSKNLPQDPLEISESDLKELQQGLQWYSYSDSDLVKNIASVKASDVDQKGLFEIALLSKRHTSSSEEARKNIIVLEPSDFSLFETQSLCISDADWVSPIKRSIITKLQEYLSSAKSLDKAKLKGFIEASASIQKEGDAKYNALPLKIDPAMLTSESIQKKIKPSLLSLAIDSSSTVGYESLGHLKAFALKIYDKRSNHLDILKFSSELEFIGDSTTDRQIIEEQLSNLSPAGGSSIYDALAKQIEILSSKPAIQKRRSIVLITDGNDKTSQITKDELIKLITDYKAKHGMLSLSILLLSPSGADAEPLQKITEAANGKIYPIEPGKLALFLANIESWL